MNRTFSVFGTMAVACAALNASAQSPMTLFPLKKGTMWQFSTTVQGRTLIQDVTVTDVKTMGNAKMATLEYKLNGQTAQTEVYRIDAKGIARVRAGAGGSGTVTPPLLVLPAKITAGAKWAWKGTINAQNVDTPGSANFTLMAPQSVSVPAGKFNAYRVRFFLNINAGAQGPMKIENSYWFAPNVGIVKQDVKVGPQTITGVLTKYKIAK